MSGRPPSQQGPRFSEDAEDGWREKRERAALRKSQQTDPGLKCGSVRFTAPDHRLKARGSERVRLKHDATDGGGAELLTVVQIPGGGQPSQARGPVPPPWGRPRLENGAARLTSLLKPEGINNRAKQPARRPQPEGTAGAERPERFRLSLVTRSRSRPP